MNTTTYFDNNLLHKNLTELSTFLEQNFGQVKVPFHEKLYNSSKESFQFLLSYTKSVIDEQNLHPSKIVFLKMLLDNSYKNELLSAGSGSISFLYAIQLIKAFSKEASLLKTENFSTLKECIEKQYQDVLFKCYSKHSSPITLLNFQSVLNNIDTDQQNTDLLNVVLEAVELAGPEGNIVIEDAHSGSDKFLVESKTGYRFDVLLYQLFLPNPNSFWKEKNVKVFLVDGILDKVSEIEHLLYASFETKLPMLIIARGFSEEVVATIKTNMDRNTLNVMPVRISPELNGLNTLNDIAVATDSSVLSSLKGDMIICQKYDALVSVDSVECHNNVLIIHHNKTKGLVNSHIQSLMLKKQEHHAVHDISVLFENRIKNLLARCISIRFPNTYSNSAITTNRIKIDTILRSLKTFISYGIITDFGNLKQDLQNTTNATSLVQKLITESILTLLEELKDKQFVSCMSFALSTYMTTKLVLDFFLSHGMII